MKQQSWAPRWWGVATLTLTAFLIIGCAKRPVTMTAGPPTPGASLPAPSSPAPAPPARTTLSPTSRSAAPPQQAPAQPLTPPPPREFVAIEALKDIHFDFDKYDIRPADAKILEENAKWMKANPTYRVLVEGHADERGTSEYNLALGERRAKATLAVFVLQGIQAGRVIHISYGEEHPVCSEKTEACWARNRRAHFLVKAR